MLLVPVGVSGQNYNTLWKEVADAQQRDLPKTAIASLQKIEDMALKGQDYGQLLKATLLHSKLQAEVAPDSLLPAVERLEQQEQKAQNAALRAVYCTVLAKIYANNHQLGDNWDARRQEYTRRATADPKALEGVKSADYEPFVVTQKDSELFDHDLLSIIGFELNAWEWMSQYYMGAGNRRAACLTALELLKSRASHSKETLEQSDYVRQLDSLIAVYGDLPEACEIAIVRYDYMDAYTTATATQKNEWLLQSMQRWPSWKRINVLKNRQLQLTNSTFQADIEWKVCEVNKPQTIRLTGLRNLQSLRMRFYRTKLSGDTSLNPNDVKDYKQIASGMTELTTHSRVLTWAGHPEYEVFEDSIQLAGLPAGVYLVEFATEPATQVSRMLYFVSGIRLITQAMPGNNMRYVVVDATTGQPVPAATVRLGFSKGWNEPMETKSLICDAKGEVTYGVKDKRPSEVFALTRSDNFCPVQNGYGRYTYYDRRYNAESISLFTDRSIYRPGQRVHVTAIVWREISATENAAVTDKKMTMELRDANHKLIAEQQVTTDAYGTCSATMTLPKGLLNGRFTIRAANSSTAFRVEEYKRPTFRVEFPDYKSSYKSGDVVKAEARATTYADVPVQGGRVRYTVKRRVAFWWMTCSWYWNSGYYGHGLQEEVVNEGETMTDDEGRFFVDMPMLLPKEQTNYSMFYNFVVEADVTDMAGETHSGTMSLPLGSKPTALTCNIPQQVRSDQMPEVTFTRRNAAGKEIAGKMKYRIDGGKWTECSANVPQSAAKWRLKSGEHKLEAICVDDTLKLTFVVFGLDDVKPATQTDDWFYVSHKEFPGDEKPVTVQVGSSDPDLHIVYSIFAGDEVIESGTIKKSRALENRKIEYDEDYGNGLLLTYAWVKNGRCHSHEVTIRRPMPDKQLKMEWHTFRDQLTPGQQEEWRLKVSNPDGTPAAVSLMSVLYDKSLDAINPHNWTFSPTTYLSLPQTGWTWHAWGRLHWGGSKDYKLFSVPTSLYSHFDQSVYPTYQYRMMHRMSGAVSRTMYSKSQPMMAMAAPETSMVAETRAVNQAADMQDAMVKKETQDAPMEEKAPEQEKVRENLDETAFCYPALETDKDGQVVLKFTLPESLTTWRFMGVAHTKDMCYGSMEAEVVAKKEIMIQPNVPRFIRMEDDARISARIFNTSEKNVSGRARMVLIDPECGATVDEQTLDFSAEAGKTASVCFSFKPMESFSLLICKVTAEGEGFSDGEQHYLPILSDREYVTKTVPYTQHEPGVKTVDLTTLFPDGTSMQKLTVEYTNNPAWLMVQSLPLVGQPWEHSAIDQAASYYSNMLAKTLLEQSPQVKTTFEQWKREEGKETSLTSNLAKDEELKDLVLSETPWVWSADRESEQKQCLADFFDENDIRYRLDLAVGKLKKLQHSDGSFSWYPGMDGSIYITMAVEEMLVRLNSMIGEQDDTRQMHDKAFNYIGKEMTKVVAEMKKAAKKGNKPTFPSFTALRWLYLCALDGRQLPSDMRAANDYLLPLLKKDIKRQTIYEKALTAVVLAKSGDVKRAVDYVKSLKEYTVFTEEMGRYYDTPRASYSWYDYKIPTEVAAIEAIQAVAPDDIQTVNEMRRWLLQERRTQMWDTPINSVNAIFAFLNGQPTTLTTTGAPTVLAIDQQPLDLPQATAGIGYVKTAISNPKGRTFAATKTSAGTSWGAVYAQFLQKTHDVEASQSGISIKRDVMAADGSPLSASVLKVGSRIKIRITIESQRDLDFVQVVDRRAACMEPVRQLSGYHDGAYCSPKDFATHYFYYGLSKGRHVIETEYYVDRAGRYETGTCTVGCAYAPEFRAIAPSLTFNINE